MAKQTKTKCQQADEILRRWIENEDREEKPSYDDMAFLRCDLGWDDRKIKSQRRRMTQVIRNQAISGCCEDREQLAAEVDRAREAFESQRDELQQQIDEATKRLNQLERDAHLAAKRSAEAEEAAERLRDLLPDDVAAEYNARKQAVNETIRRDLLDVEADIKHIGIIQSLDPNNPRDIDVIRSQGSHFVTTNASGKPGVTPEWRKHLDIEVNRLGELEADRDELQGQYDEAMAKLDGLRCCYVR